MDFFNLKVMILVIFAEVVISSIPHSRTRRHKKLHSNRPPNAQRLLLKVNNFSRTHLQLNTPTNRRTVRLWSRNGFYLQVSKNLTPIGNRTPNARANFELQSVDTSIVRLENVSTKRYLAINQHGRLRLKRQPDDDCLFKEVEEENYFHSFASHKYYNNRKHDIFIGIKTNGDIKSPRTTAPGQKAVLFIHRPVTQPTPQTQG